MRDTFVRVLTNLVKNDSDIVLLTADLGFGVFDEFASLFPQNYVNVGISEQNMASMAAGMAMEGAKVFAYSIGNFPTLRALEQIRSDIAYHNANVKIVSVGAGFSYGPLGMSHHATEDIAIMRAIPEIDVYVPGCLWEVEQITNFMGSNSGPAYLRLDKSHAGDTSLLGESFEYGKMRTIIQGKDVAVLCCGGILTEGLAAARSLKDKGISTTVVSVPFICPIDVESINKIIGEHKLVITVEEHLRNGGLGSAVLEVCGDSDKFPVKHIRIGLVSKFETVVGTQKYLRTLNGLSSEMITKTVLSSVER